MADTSQARQTDISDKDDFIIQDRLDVQVSDRIRVLPSAGGRFPAFDMARDGPEPYNDRL
jgi:hypothetical protein